MQIHHGQTKRKAKQMTIIYMEIYKRGETKKCTEELTYKRNQKTYTIYQ